MSTEMSSDSLRKTYRQRYGIIYKGRDGYQYWGSKNDTYKERITYPDGTAIIKQHYDNGVTKEKFKTPEGK